MNTQLNELIELLRTIKPKFGAVGSRDDEVQVQRAKIDDAITRIQSLANTPDSAAQGAMGDGRALQLSRQIMAIVNGTWQPGGATQIQAKIQEAILAANMPESEMRFRKPKGQPVRLKPLAVKQLADLIMSLSLRVAEQANNPSDTELCKQADDMLIDLAQPSDATARPSAEHHVFIQPGWNHVSDAFINGAKEQAENPTAVMADWLRAADGYTKRVHEQVDPETERRLRENDWPEVEVAQPYDATAQPSKIDFPAELARLVRVNDELRANERRLINALEVTQPIVDLTDERAAFEIVRAALPKFSLVEGDWLIRAVKVGPYQDVEEAEAIHIDTINTIIRALLANTAQGKPEQTSTKPVGYGVIEREDFATGHDSMFVWYTIRPTNEEAQQWIKDRLQSLIDGEVEPLPDFIVVPLTAALAAKKG